jgi:hypothetical protein
MLGPSRARERTRTSTDHTVHKALNLWASAPAQGSALPWTWNPPLTQIWVASPLLFETSWAVVETLNAPPKPEISPGQPGSARRRVPRSIAP